MKTAIHINHHKLTSNRKTGAVAPVLMVKTYKDSRNAHEAIILDKAGNEVARVLHRPDKPLSCGAHVWIETQNEVRVQTAGFDMHSPLQKGTGQCHTSKQ